MQPDLPEAGQLASFDQTFAALTANLGSLLGTYGAMLADGEQPDLAIAGMAQWLFVNHDAATLSEHLAAAVRRLHTQATEVERLQALLEQAEQYARDLQDGGIFLHDEAVATVRQEGLAEGRRQATDEAKRDAERAQEAADNRANAAWGEGYAEARKEVTAEADQAYWRGHELGRRQATEGWDRQWGVRGDGGGVEVRLSEESAHRFARRFEPDEATVVSRLVGPWEPAEEPYALVDSEGRCGCCNGVGDHRCGHECDSCDGSGRNPDSPVCRLPHGADCTCAEPASGGVVEPSGPLTAEEATAECVVPVRSGYRCTLGGDACPGHSSKWLMCGTGTSTIGTVLTVPMGEPGPPEGEALGVTDAHRHDFGKAIGDLRDRYGPRRQHDPGLLIEEPDLYEQGEGDR